MVSGGKRCAGVLGQVLVDYVSVVCPGYAAQELEEHD